MKRLLNIALIASVVLFTTACETDEERELRLDRQHEIKMAKIESGQDAMEQEMRHERNLAYIQRPVAPGNYTDYRGNSSYGYWNSGSWMWNDPNSHYASQSRHYVDYNMSMGVLGTAVLTQALFNSNNSNGWQKTEVNVNNYTSISGDKIDKTKYNKNLKKADKKVKKQKKYVAKNKTNKSPVSVKATPKPKGKWDSKRTKPSKYASNGFNKKFADNSKKSKAKANKSSYSKTTKTTKTKVKYKPKKKTKKQSSKSNRK
jgi:hypothetical protein